MFSCWHKLLYWIRSGKYEEWSNITFTFVTFSLSFNSNKNTPSKSGIVSAYSYKIPEKNTFRGKRIVTRSKHTLQQPGASQIICDLSIPFFKKSVGDQTQDERSKHAATVAAVKSLPECYVKLTKRSKYVNEHYNFKILHTLQIHFLDNYLCYCYQCILTSNELAIGLNSIINKQDLIWT